MSLTSTAVSAPAPPALALHIGVTLALDDFGTGYSSLGSLDTLPIDTIKVDQPFIAKLCPKPASQAIVTAQQHHEVTQLGSDSCQGLYFGKPPPSAAATPQTGR
jgi:EAL domain-containing protein (putative c-di-GMP-specific phosphodiesterase class I)